MYVYIYIYIYIYIYRHSLLQPCQRPDAVRFLAFPFLDVPRLVVFHGAMDNGLATYDSWHISCDVAVTCDPIARFPTWMY